MKDDAHVKGIGECSGIGKGKSPNRFWDGTKPTPWVTWARIKTHTPQCQKMTGLGEVLLILRAFQKNTCNREGVVEKWMKLGL